MMEAFHPVPTKVWLTSWKKSGSHTSDGLSESHRSLNPPFIRTCV